MLFGKKIDCFPLGLEDTAFILQLRNLPEVSGEFFLTLRSMILSIRNGFLPLNPATCFSLFVKNQISVSGLSVFQTSLTGIKKANTGLLYYQSIREKGMREKLANCWSIMFFTIYRSGRYFWKHSLRTYPRLSCMKSWDLFKKGYCVMNFIKAGDSRMSWWWPFLRRERLDTPANRRPGFFVWKRRLLK